MCQMSCIEPLMVSVIWHLETGATSMSDTSIVSEWSLTKICQSYDPKIEWHRWMMRFNYVEWIYTQFSCMENLLLQILLLTCFSCFYIFIEKSLICYLVFIYFLLSTFSFYLVLLVTCLFQLFTIIFLTFLVIISCLECISNLAYFMAEKHC